MHKLKLKQCVQFSVVNGKMPDLIYADNRKYNTMNATNVYLGTNTRLFVVMVTRPNRQQNNPNIDSVGWIMNDLSSKNYTHTYIVY